jgi:hypothetical protein
MCLLIRNSLFHIDGHTNIQSKGSFVIHAQTQCEDESPNLKASHNDAFSAPSNDSFIVANPSKIENPVVDLTKIKFEMLEDRVIFDAGNRDMLIKCNHFDVENVSEINDTTGHDHSTHHGTSYDEFYGESEEHYHGIKTETFGPLAATDDLSTASILENRGTLTATTTNTDINETFTNCHISETYTGGHINSSYTGTATDQYYGNKFEFTFSSVETINTGHSVEVFGGLKEELSLANSFDLYVGLKEEIKVAGTLDVSLAANAEFMFGFQTGVTMAGFLKYTGGFGIDKTSAKLDSTDAELAEVKTVLKKVSAELKSHDVTMAVYKLLAIS